MHTPDDRTPYVCVQSQPAICTQQDPCKQQSHGLLAAAQRVYGSFLWIISRKSRSQVLSSPMSVCLFVTVLVGVQPDRQPSSRQQRLVRATGAAVGVGVGLMENCIPGTGGRLMVFTGGPCTTGPGAVVGLALEDSIRTHRVTHCSWQTIRREWSLDHSCMQSCLIHVGVFLSMAYIFGTPCVVLSSVSLP